MDTKGIRNRILYYEDGEVIFEENSVGNEMYIIESGKVEISRRICGRKTTIVMLGKGDFFGEMAMFTDTPRSVTTLAVGRTTLMSFSIEEILQHVQTNFQFAVTLLQALMNRLHKTTFTLSTLIAKVYDFGDGFMENLLHENLPLKIGEILVEMDCLTKIHLERALQKQKEIHILEHRHKLLGEILIEAGIITQEQLRDALAEQRIRLRYRFE